MNLSLMNMAKGPIVKAHPDKICDTAGRIDVMAWGTGERAVKHGNVYGSLYRLLETRQQTVCSMPFGKADSMDPDIVCEFHLSTASVEHMHIVWQVEGACYWIFSVMIALDIEDLDPDESKSVEFSREKGPCSSAALFPIKEIARDQ